MTTQEEEYDKFSEEDFYDAADPTSQSSLEIAEQEILAELLRSLIDITAGPPTWTRSPLLKDPQNIDLVVTPDDQLLAKYLVRQDDNSTAASAPAESSSSETNPPS